MQMNKMKFYEQIYHQRNNKIGVSVQHCVVPLIYSLQLVTMAFLAMLGPFTGSTQTSNLMNCYLKIQPFSSGYIYKSQEPLWSICMQHNHLHCHAYLQMHSVQFVGKKACTCTDRLFRENICSQLATLLWAQKYTNNFFFIFQQ